MKRLFDYDDWANREEVRHLRALASPPARAVKILAHIVGTQWLWIGRLRRDPKPAAIWPDLTLDEIAYQLDRLRDEWPHEFEKRELIEYVNTKGERWTSASQDILMHAVLHGAYHRGQIATIVRDAGSTPAYTDYIECIRREWLG